MSKAKEILFWGAITVLPFAAGLLVAACAEEADGAPQVSSRITVVPQPLQGVWCYILENSGGQPDSLSCVKQ